KHLRKEKAIVGGTKQINIDRIKTLKPDIVLCNKEENTKSIIEALEAIAPIHISDIANLEDCYKLISMYGELFNAEAIALSIVSRIQKERQTFKSKNKTNKKLKVAYFIWKNPWMVIASNTFINYMLSEAGFINVFEKEERYPEVDLNDTRLKKTDTIFLSSEPYPFKEKHILELQMLFPNKQIMIVNGELFSWYGSRLLKSYTYFESLHGLK
ncbi:helical backbone metal receptor, partial [uncultured Winogradskyella sp.]|uniref:ABC transporter substrate-binding protein n=1 Tax=uncultured Winogradskyella sp. TaxID=395353 RepID=UPI002636A30B